VASKGGIIPHLCTATPGNPITCRTKAGHLCKSPITSRFQPSRSKLSYCHL